MLLYLLLQSTRRFSKDALFQFAISQSEGNKNAISLRKGNTISDQSKSDLVAALAQVGVLAGAWLAGDKTSRLLGGESTNTGVVESALATRGLTTKVEFFNSVCWLELGCSRGVRGVDARGVAAGERWQTSPPINHHIIGLPIPRSFYESHTPLQSRRAEGTAPEVNNLLASTGEGSLKFSTGEDSILRYEKGFVLQEIFY